VVGDDELMQATTDLAASIATYPSYGLTLTKEAFWHNVAHGDLRAGIALENRNQRLASASPEVQAYMGTYTSRHKKEGDDR
jgi:hypothetical protein